MASSERKILVIDVGGTNVKMLASGEDEWRTFPSGPTLRAKEMASRAKRLTRDWDYDAVTIGFPGPLAHGRPLQEPGNLGPGWVGFDFHKAFGRPVKLMNDAAIQALGSYNGGSMLYLSLGTGLGCALIVDWVLEDAEVGQFPYKGGRGIGSYVSKEALERLGLERWKKNVLDVVDVLRAYFEVEYVVLGGGNSDELDGLPPKTSLADKNAAFTGGCLLWTQKEVKIGVPVREVGRAAPQVEGASPAVLKNRPFVA